MAKAKTKPKQKPKPKYYIASFSGGKDSTAMVLRLIELGYPLHEVICCDTTMEFPAMYRHIEKVRAVVEAAGIKFTILRAEHDFEWFAIHFPVKTEKGRASRIQKNMPIYGKGWPTSRIRWCTDELKRALIHRYLNQIKKSHDLKQYIGIAADEGYRLERAQAEKHGKTYPLVEWQWTEADAMRYCRSKGYDWEGLYTFFKRVSCWHCPLQPLSELKTLRKHFPTLWAELMELDKRIRAHFGAISFAGFKDGYSVAELDKRFDLEEALEAAGEKITNRAFYTDLRRHLSGEVTVAEIILERQEKRAAEIAAKQIPGQACLFN